MKSYINKLCILLLLTLTTPFYSYAGLELVIEGYRQWGTNTCWAACSKMILGAYGCTINGGAIDEKTIRCWAFPNEPCTGSGPDLTNQLFGLTRSTDKVLQNYGNIYSNPTDFNTSTQGGNISQTDLTKEIDQGRPILCGRVIADGTSTGRKHMLLIRGYEGSGGSNAGKVIYNDPSDGQRYSVPYDEFVRKGNAFFWYQTLRLTTNPKVKIPTGTGPNEYVLIQTGTSNTVEISQSTRTLSFTALKYGNHVPVCWNWRLIFSTVDGEYIVKSWNAQGSNFTSTWNISNFTLPSNIWNYNFDGKIPGRVEVTVDDNAGPPSHSDAINALYIPSNLYPGILIYENRNISTPQIDVKAHEQIIAQTDQFLSGGNVSLKAGQRIDINDGVTINNGSVVNLVIDPTLR
jgi:hypothetical protein